MSINTVTNQSHKLDQEGYFEWWYVHFVSEEGGRINIVLHETDIFGLNRVPYISISLLLNDGVARHYRRDLTPSEIITQNGGTYLQATDGLFDEDEQGLHFRVHIDDLQFSGCIRKLAPPAVIEDGILFEDGSRKNWWVAQIPYGEFDAKLELDGVSYSLNGFAYQDHNWGTAPIQNHFKDWIWGYFGDSQGAITFYRIGTLNGDLIDRVVLTSRMEILTATRLDTPFLNELSSILIPEKANSDVLVTFPEYGGKLTFQLSQRNLMRKRLSEPYADFLVTYCRWAASGELNALRERRSVRGVAEYLYIA